MDLISSHERDPLRQEWASVEKAVEDARRRSPSLWGALLARGEWEVYTDGSAPFKNPGGAIGFSAVFLVDTDDAFETYGGVLGRKKEPATSNNRAEISGALLVLETVRQAQRSETGPSSLTLWCDSQYVVNCAQGRWKKHKNLDLWNRYDRVFRECKLGGCVVELRWTRAHVGTRWNERADVLAKEGAESAVRAYRETKVESDQRVQRGGQEVHQEPKDPIPSGGLTIRLEVASRMAGTSRAEGVWRWTSAKQSQSGHLPATPVRTLDEAEYRTLKQALEQLLQSVGGGALRAHLEAVSCRDLFVKQLQGQYQVKSPHLEPLYRAVLPSLRRFGQVTWTRCAKSSAARLFEEVST